MMDYSDSFILGGNSALTVKNIIVQGAQEIALEVINDGESNNIGVSVYKSKDIEYSTTATGMLLQSYSCNVLEIPCSCHSLKLVFNNYDIYESLISYRIWEE